MKIQDYKKKMKKCYQIKDKQTIQAHGYMVFKYSVDLLNAIKGFPSKFNQKVPECFYKIKVEDLVGYKTLKHYAMWHDMGKPFCLPDS